MKVIHIILKVLLSLIVLSPILGVLGIFPEPTADMYNTDEAFAFIQLLMDSGYVMVLLAVGFLASAIFLWTGREALASLILLPFTVNIIGFHAFLDGGIFTPGAIMANVLVLLNIYFLWYSRKQISLLFKKTT